MERAWAMVVRRLAAIHLRRHAHLCRLSAVASSCGKKVGNLQRGGRGRRAFFIRSRQSIRWSMWSNSRAGAAARGAHYNSEESAIAGNLASAVLTGAANPEVTIVLSPWSHHDFLKIGGE